MIESQLNWEKLYQIWLSHIENNQHRDAQKLESKIRLHLNNRKLKDIDWIIDAIHSYDSLSIPNNRVNLILRALNSGNQMPNLLFEPMIKAGVYEINPSLNRLFVEPCLRCFGVRKVISKLIEYFTIGTNREKAGAASTFYWAFGLNGSEGIKAEDVHEYKNTVNNLLLEEFVNNDDINVRRRIIPQLFFDQSKYHSQLRHMIPKAIAIARTHPDEYIRHRIEIQLGSGGSFMPIPY